MNEDIIYKEITIEQLNEYAYPDCPNEVQLLWYLDL